MNGVGAREFNADFISGGGNGSLSNVGYVSGSAGGKYKYIIHSKSENGHIHTITINRPKKMNAISFETMAEVEKCVEEDVNPYDSLARVLIIRGAGKHFTSGLDMKSAQ